jgi:hypothetical protein
MVNELASSLDPHYRSWLVSQAVPHVWASTFALNFDKGEGAAIVAADAAAGAVKRIANAPPPSPEEIIGKSGFIFSYEDFRGWYRVVHRLRQPLGSLYKSPSDREVERIFSVCQRNRGDFS